MKMTKTKQFYNKYIRNKRLKDNPIFSILIFFPASIITSILIIPIVIITYPLVYLFRKQELTIVKIGLYIQHCLGLSFWFTIEDMLLSKVFSVNWSFDCSAVIINGLIAFIVLMQGGNS